MTTIETPEKPNLLSVDPDPQFELSPYLYMQYMQTVGVTDGSLEAAWDFLKSCWREDVVEVTKELAPTMMRWLGLNIAYYRWREGVGPREERKSSVDLVWGGMFSNQVGTAEFVDLCRQVGAEPLMCVNFESEGNEEWMADPFGDNRTAGPEEACEWIDYCNNPSNALRNQHGFKDPFNIKFWQIGNETSYEQHKGYDPETAARRTLAFARKMHETDSSIKAIGWGEHGYARPMIEIAGEQLQYIAFHHMFNPFKEAEHNPLDDRTFREDSARTWHALMESYKVHAAKIDEMRESVSGCDIPLVLTECHYSLPGFNRGEVLSTWAAGVAQARLMNLHERNGDVLKIATLADYCGTRWKVNAIMIPTPQRWGGQAFMMPVAKVMALYRRHTGEQALGVKMAPADLDVTASRTLQHSEVPGKDRFYLHVVNTNMERSVSCSLQIEGFQIRSARVFEIAADPRFDVVANIPDPLVPREKEVAGDGLWTFPPASVSAVEIEI